jgi:hypothetical protein
MTDTFLPLLKAVVAALKADSTIAGLVGARVYSNVPQNETFPYVLVSISTEDFSAKDFTGMDHTIQINSYGRERSPNVVGQIKAACYALLNRQESALTLDTGTLSILQFNGVSDAFKDPDGITWESVIRFQAIVT